MNVMPRLTISLTAAFFLCAPVLSGAAGCLQCHPDILQQLQGRSHHVQGTPVTTSHCYACHWEAAADGGINEKFHRTTPDVINLVIWSNGKRPALHEEGKTAVSFSQKAFSTTEERDESAKITRHCLACHNDSSGAGRPFAGDSNTPQQFAWDGKSISSRYEQKTVTPWGKYSTATTNRKKQLGKALSAHGNAAANQGGWSRTGGYDAPVPLTRGGGSARNVECYDCHNSHGSSVSGITSSYLTREGTHSGGLLKVTVAGKGGYPMNYSPAKNLNSRSRNPYNPGAGLCFDCHETETAGTAPWGYSTTFGASRPIMGYKDSHRFDSGLKGSTSRYANRQGRSEIVSSHLKAGIFLKYSAAESINGLCTPCHDPHGVSQTLGDKMPYAVPLLKGTWLTSPYREDAPPANAQVRTESAKQSNWMVSGAAGTSRGPVSMQGMQYNVDRNTFPPGSTITEDAATFGGLCLRCHDRLDSRGESRTARIHKAVKGWGDNREHSFPCAKCHQAHNSGLPRLMQTNCFEEGPAGLRDTIGLSWLSGKREPAGSRESDNRRSASNSSSEKTGFVGCHVRQFGRSGSIVPQKEGEDWNKKTQW